MRALPILAALASCAPAETGAARNEASPAVAAYSSADAEASGQARPGRATGAPAAVATTPPRTVDNRSRAVYRCVDGSRFVARFDPDNRRVTVDLGGIQKILRQERVASGIRYAAGGYVLEGKGDRLTFTQPRMPPLPCTVNRR